MELTETVEMMTSTDCKERLKAEFFQTCIRQRKLGELLSKWDLGELGFVPACPYELLNRQYDAMEQYLLILEERARIEDVEL